jgi:NADH-quinone oxidoreductase subunit E
MPTAVVNRILNKYKDNKTALISILQDIQEEFNYLPAEALKLVAEKLKLQLIDVYGVATFYKSLRLSPQGKHNITLCTGTACHVRGTHKILDEIQSQLGIAPGNTTPDKKFTFNTVNCLGACAIGPVLVIDGKYNGSMTPIKVRQILSDYIKKVRSKK